MSNSYIRSHTSKITVLQYIIDGLVVAGSLYLAASFYEVFFGNYQKELSFVAVISFYAIGQARGLYGSWRINSIRSEINEIIVVWVMVFSTVLALAYLTKVSTVFPRRIMLTWLILAPVLLVVVRIIVRLLLRKLRRYGRNIRSVAIAGANQVAFKVVEKLSAMPWTGLVFKGYFDDRSEDRLPSEMLPMLAGNLSNLLDQARTGNIDTIYIALPMHSEQRIIDLVNKIADTTASVYLLPDFFIFELTHARWVNLDGMPVVSIYETPFAGVDGWVKRMEDIVLGLVILAAIALPLLTIALAVKMTSPGPVIFKQRRYGLNGELVHVWKFRSMSVCEDGNNNFQQARQGDTRITPLGAFLRKTSLDELPQFINVLQGTMSIVGPRPHPIALNEQYRGLIHGYMLRHKVKPGITGWAQANGWRGETDTLEKMQKRIEFDLEYIQDWSLWLDLKIIWMTICGGFRGRNAY